MKHSLLIHITLYCQFCRGWPLRLIVKTYHDGSSCKIHPWFWCRLCTVALFVCDLMVSYFTIDSGWSKFAELYVEAKTCIQHLYFCNEVTPLPFSEIYLITGFITSTEEFVCFLVNIVQESAPKEAKRNASKTHWKRLYYAVHHLDLSMCPLLPKSLQPPLRTYRVVIQPESSGWLCIDPYAWTTLQLNAQPGAAKFALVSRNMRSKVSAMPSRNVSNTRRGYVIHHRLDSSYTLVYSVIDNSKPRLD